MSVEEIQKKFEGISLRLEENNNLPKVKSVRLLITLPLNHEGESQVGNLKMKYKSKLKCLMSITLYFLGILL